MERYKSLIKRLFKLYCQAVAPTPSERFNPRKSLADKLLHRHFKGDHLQFDREIAELLEALEHAQKTFHQPANPPPLWPTRAKLRSHFQKMGTETAKLEIIAIRDKWLEQISAPPSTAPIPIPIPSAAAPTKIIKLGVLKFNEKLQQVDRKGYPPLILDAAEDFEFVKICTEEGPIDTATLSKKLWDEVNLDGVHSRKYELNKKIKQLDARITMHGKSGYVVHNLRKKPRR